MRTIEQTARLLARACHRHRRPAPLRPGPEPLEPLNRNFRSIELTEEDEEAVAVVAEFVESSARVHRQTHVLTETVLDTTGTGAHNGLQRNATRTRLVSGRAGRSNLDS